MIEATCFLDVAQRLGRHFSAEELHNMTEDERTWAVALVEPLDDETRAELQQVLAVRGCSVEIVDGWGMLDIKTALREAIHHA